MGCFVLKKILSYEICLLEREPHSMFNRDEFVAIRKSNYLELVDVSDKDNISHSTGDIIKNEDVRSSVYQWISDNWEYCEKEIK